MNGIHHKYCTHSPVSKYSVQFRLKCFWLVDVGQMVSAHFVYIEMFTGVTGKRTTLTTVMIAAFIWMLAILCAIPALIGSNVKVCNTLLDKFKFQ